MEKYTKAQMEVIEFEAEDVITESIPIDHCPYDGGCKIEDLFDRPSDDCHDQILYASESDLLPKAPSEKVRAWYVQVLLPVP